MGKDVDPPVVFNSRVLYQLASTSDLYKSGTGMHRMGSIVGIEKLTDRYIARGIFEDKFVSKVVGKVALK